MAQFCDKHFGELFFSSSAFKSKEYENAIRQCFLRLEEMIEDPAYLQELVSLSQGKERMMITVQNTGCSMLVGVIADSTLIIGSAG